MKVNIILAIAILTSMLNANIIATQNMKALYKGVELTEVQKDYILDNQDNNIDVIQKILTIEIEKKNIKYLNEKNVISFILTPDGEITKIKFLKTSNNRKLDSMTKRAIKKASKVFIKPEEQTQMRFIISYKIEQSQKNKNYSNENQTTKVREIYYIPIASGTTRF